MDENITSLAEVITVKHKVHLRLMEISLVLQVSGHKENYWKNY